MSFTDGFLKGFAGELGKGIRANEAEKLKTQRANALAAKQESLARFKATETEKTAQKTRDVKVSEGALDRTSREKIAALKDEKGDKKDTITRKEATYLAQKTGLIEPEEINIFADRMQGKTVREIEEIGTEEGWWSKKFRQTGELFGFIAEEDKTPTTAPPSMGAPKTTTPTTPTVPPTVSGPPAATSPTLDTKEQKEAPPKALDILKNDPSKRNIALFKRRFGYIPQEYK